MNTTEWILRLALAIIVGGFIGAEREYVSKAAGLRTLMLISLGSAMFTIFSIIIGVGLSPDRIASNIVTGIGFLGAGVIFKEDNRVKGLTTAASVWSTAAIGMGIGAGYYWISIAGAVLAFIALSFMTTVEDWIEKTNQVREYRIVCHYKNETLHRFEEKMRECRLYFKRNKQSLTNENIIGMWSVKGSEKRHEQFIQMILKDDTVKEFDF
jgi:putative Mg2+ transporter-C (MgtC) family protein